MTHTTTMNSRQNKAVLKYLLDKRPHTTLDIFKATKTINVAVVISSIRKNGYRIDCKLLKATKHSKVYTYTLKNKIAKKAKRGGWVRTTTGCVGCDHLMHSKKCPEHTNGSLKCEKNGRLYIYKATS